jgi:lysophospholipase L1-like esterase
MVTADSISMAQNNQLLQYNDPTERLRNLRIYQKLLILLLAVNLLGLLGGGFYVYKTKSVPIRWYNKYIKRVSYPRDRRYYRQRLNVFNLLKEEVTGKKAIIFVGNSLIDTFEWAEYFTDLEDTVILNRGIGGDTIDRLIERFDSTFLAGYNPQRIFIMVGINDISSNNFQVGNFIKKYRVLLEKLSVYIPPDKICVHSILPVRNREDKPITEIKKINQYLRLYAHEKDLHYIDLYDKLIDSTGQLDAKYSLDGIHLTSEGYKVWLETIKPYVLSPPVGTKEET